MTTLVLFINCNNYYIICYTITISYRRKKVDAYRLEGQAKAGKTVQLPAIFPAIVYMVTQWLRQMLAQETLSYEIYHNLGLNEASAWAVARRYKASIQAVLHMKILFICYW